LRFNFLIIFFSITKELNFCHKFKFLESLHVCITWWCKPLIFQTKNIWSCMIYSLKYLRSTTLGLEDIGITISEFVTKTHFLYKLSKRILKIMLCWKLGRNLNWHRKSSSLYWYIRRRRRRLTTQLYVFRISIWNIDRPRKTIPHVEIIFTYSTRALGSRSTFEFPSRVNLSGPSLYCITRALGE